MKTTIKHALFVLLVLAAVAAPTSLLAFESFDSYPGFSYDIGGSTGYDGSDTFYEINAALNTHVNPWAVWRNSIFYRGQSGADDFYGLDTSALFGRRWPVGDRTGFSVKGGGGYRFTSTGQHAPFAEAGADLAGDSWRIGVNSKYILYELVGDSRENEFLIGIVLSGSTSGRF
jgi:hypothetical protein